MKSLWKIKSIDHYLKFGFVLLQFWSKVNSCFKFWVALKNKLVSNHINFIINIKIILELVSLQIDALFRAISVYIIVINIVSKGV